MTTMMAITTTARIMMTITRGMMILLLESVCLPDEPVLNLVSARRGSVGNKFTHKDN